MRTTKLLILFNALVILITCVIFFTTLAKRQSQQNVLGERDIIDVASLRCPDCNVILIGIDTLRADHLSSYGYIRDTSSNIDKWAEKGILFKNVFSQSSKTTPSFMSMLTSLYPSDHGIMSVLFSDPIERPIVKINDSIKTLPQILKDNGYQTYAIVNTAQLPPELGFAQGFDEFTLRLGDGENRPYLLKLLAKMKSQKFFVFYHDNEVHGPYTPPPPYDMLYDPSYNGKISTHELREARKSQVDLEEDTIDKKIKKIRETADLASKLYWSNVNPEEPRDIEHLKALYDGEIKHLDDFIGQLQNVLTETGLWQNTIIIFTADHGEEFYEHGEREHNQLYNETLHVPLIISLPAISDKREITNRIRLVDIMPTILDVLGITINSPTRGNTLLPLIANPSKHEDLPVVSTQLVYKIPENSFITDNDKLVKKRIGTDLLNELYNLASDPSEKENLVEKDSDKAIKLENLLQETLSNKNFTYDPIPINLELDTEKRDNLRSLGY